MIKIIRKKQTTTFKFKSAEVSAVNSVDKRLQRTSDSKKYQEDALRHRNKRHQVAEILSFGDEEKDYEREQMEINMEEKSEKLSKLKIEDEPSKSQSTLEIKEEKVQIELKKSAYCSEL